MTYQHQHDLNGCGIAALSNLLEKDYLDIKKEFEGNFYKINKGIKVFDIVRFLETKGLRYKTVYQNSKKITLSDATKLAETPDSITLIQKSEKYPVGHYLVRKNNKWIDSWLNYPSINNVHAGEREELPGYPWYVVVPIPD